MDKATVKLKEYKDIAKVFNDNNIKLAKLNSGITELEKFNATIQKRYVNFKVEMLRKQTMKNLTISKKCVIL